MSKVFGLSKGVVTEVVQQVRQALEQWPEYAEQAGVDEEQMQRVSKVFQV